MDTSTKKITLGTAQFGLDYGINNPAGKVPLDQVKKILGYAKKNGVEFIDTAAAYGESEKVLGEAGASSFKVISKLQKDTKPGEAGKRFEESCDKLKTRTLYGYIFHDFSTYRGNRNIWEELCQLKKEGRVEKIGFSIYSPGELEEIIKDKLEFDLIQIPYSVFDQRFSNYFPMLRSKGVEINVRSVFLQGLVFKDPLKLDEFFLPIKAKLLKLREISDNGGVTIEALCLGFAVLNKDIDKIVIGVDNVENLEDNIKVFENVGAVSEFLPDLSGLKESDENILLPFNWRHN